MSTGLVLIAAAAAEWSCSRSSQRTINQATEDLADGHPQQAEVRYRTILKREPTCGLAMHGLGIALLRQNQAGAALEG